MNTTPNQQPVVRCVSAQRTVALAGAVLQVPGFAPGDLVEVAFVVQGAQPAAPRTQPGVQQLIEREVELAFAEQMKHAISYWLAARTPEAHLEWRTTVEQLLAQRRFVLAWSASLKTDLAQPAQPASGA